MATETGDVISFQVPVDMLDDLMYEDELELEIGKSQSIGVEVNEIIPLEDQKGQLAVVGTVLWVRGISNEVVME